jgi:hypothetical protein
MKNRTLGMLAAGLLMVATSTSAAFAQAKPMPTKYLPDIQIVQCFVTQPKLMSKKASGTQIVYINRGTHTYSSITFAVGYRNSESNFLRRVTDQGAFAPGVHINHHFSLYNDVTFGGKATTSCGALSAK